MRQPASGTNPIWYQLAQACADRAERPMRRDERLCFIEGVVAAFELAEENELLIDLQRDIEALEADFAAFPSGGVAEPSVGSNTTEGSEFIEPPC